MPDERLETAVKLHVWWVLNEHGWRKKEAAKALGIGRTTLYRMIDKWRLKRRTHGTGS